MRANMFGKELYPLFYPYMGMTSTLAFSIGFPLIGYIYDGCGSYAPTYFMAYIGIGIAFTLYMPLSRQLKNTNPCRNKKKPPIGRLF